MKTLDTHLGAVESAHTHALTAHPRHPSAQKARDYYRTYYPQLFK